MKRDKKKVIIERNLDLVSADPTEVRNIYLYKEDLRTLKKSISHLHIVDFEG